jgi:CIC family chloride channel protein
LVAHALIGENPAFVLESNVQSPGLSAYLLIPVVAALAALVGMYFQKGTMALRAQRLEFKKIPGWLRPAMGGGVTWVLGASVFLLSGSAGVFGLGYTALTEALAGQFDWSLAALLLSAKLLATIACYGFGGCGGIFSPTLFFGCMCGIVVARLMAPVLPLQETDNVLLAVIGMSACMGAVVRAPVTSILIVFEMTHEFALVPPLMLGTLVSQAVSRSLAKHNFYEELLQQDGHALEHVIPPRDMQSWQQLHVSSIASFKPVILRDVTPETLQLTIKNHPYLYFPVMFDQKLTGVLSRSEAEAALKEERRPKLEEAVDCRPTESIRDLQIKLIESTSGIVVLTDRPGGRVLGLVTLHDLFRAEVAISDTADE